MTGVICLEAVYWVLRCRKSRGRDINKESEWKDSVKCCYLYGTSELRVSTHSLIIMETSTNSQKDQNTVSKTITVGGNQVHSVLTAHSTMMGWALAVEMVSGVRCHQPYKEMLLGMLAVASCVSVPQDIEPCSPLLATCISTTSKKPMYRNG